MQIEKEELDAIRVLHGSLPDESIVDTVLSIVEILTPDGIPGIGTLIKSNNDNIDATRLLGLAKQLEWGVVMLALADQMEDDEDEDE
jgi:hypothetical protein